MIDKNTTIEWFVPSLDSRYKRGLEYVTILKKVGRISISQTFWNNNELDGFKYVQLGYDKGNNIIAVKLSHERCQSGYKIVCVKGKQHSFHAKSFLDFHNIDYAITRNYSVRWNEIEQLLLVDLSTIADMGISAS